MKFISLFIFIVALVYTWSLSHHQMPVTESVHVGIQQDLKNIIRQYIEQHVSNATDVQFIRMWSETVEDSRVKAHFIYSFVDGSKTRLEMDGYAILNKLSESSEEVKYSFDELHIQNQSVAFEEPMRITADGTERPPEESEETHQEQQHSHHH